MYDLIHLNKIKNKALAIFDIIKVVSRGKPLKNGISI